MEEAQIVYRHNAAPNRGLAAAGIVLIKPVMLIPHIVVVSIGTQVALVVSWIGFWVTAVTGNRPKAVDTLGVMFLRWSTRSLGWLGGLVDEYPPMDTDPPGYPVDAVVTTEDEPSRMWAVLGVLGLRAVAAVPLIVFAAFLAVGVTVATWIGYFIVALTGVHQRALQDFVAGVLQLGLRIGSFLYGLTDDYPRFDFQASPAG